MLYHKGGVHSHRGEKRLIKCNESEETMIYSDKEWGKAISEELESNAEVNVENMSGSEARDQAVNDLLSGSLREGG